MRRVFQSLISLLLLLSVNAVANGTNDVMAKAATDFAGNFVSGIIPILVLVAIISIGLSMVQKKTGNHGVWLFNDSFDWFSFGNY